jgi:glycosyltransferase involved in cell wall biosynthesis/GT2 family glycosyltransferase
MPRPPRVTLALSAYNRTTYLQEALESCFDQDYDDYEILVVDNGSTDDTPEVLSTFSHPRLRILTLPENVGIAGVYNVIAREARGELIARLGDDDVNLPDRLSRSVAVFDRFPGTGIVVGDAIEIDEHGARTGYWESLAVPRRNLTDHLVAVGCALVDPTAMVRREVFEKIGDYDATFPQCNDYDFWLRALQHFRFRHAGQEPVLLYRRHASNFSHGSKMDNELYEVERIIQKSLLRTWSLRELVPHIDWPGLGTEVASKHARTALAANLEQRSFPLAAATALEVPDDPPYGRESRRSERPQRLLLTTVGWDEPGGGTQIARMLAKELVRRGHDVTVFCAAKTRLAGSGPDAVTEVEVDGIRLVSVHNRAPGPLENPARIGADVDEPVIAAAFGALLDRVQPDVIHVHSLQGLGASLLDQAFARGVRSVLSTHDLWLLCARFHLLKPDHSLCDGPPEGGRGCASCLGAPGQEQRHADRNAALKHRVAARVDRCLAVSSTVKRVLSDAGFAKHGIDVVRQGAPAVDLIWERTGKDRTPGLVGDALRVAMFGAGVPHKGLHLLVEAAQKLPAGVRVEVHHGGIPPAYARRLMTADVDGRVELCGYYYVSELPELLSRIDVAVVPSAVWETAGLVVEECHAAGVPVVAANMGGLAEGVRDGVDGLLFDGLSSDDLAEKLTRIATEQGLLETLQAGIERPRSFSEYVDDLERVYAGEDADAGLPERPAAIRWAAPLPSPEVVAALQADERLILQWAAPGTPASPPALPFPATLIVDAAKAAALPSDPAALADVLAAGRPAPEPAEPLAELAELGDVVLATPAWRGQDRLGELLAAWQAVPADSGLTLALMVDGAVDGAPEAWEDRVLAAAAAHGASLDGGADIAIIEHPAGADPDRLHAASVAYVPLHGACGAHARLAAASGSAVLEPAAAAFAAFAASRKLPRAA